MKKNPERFNTETITHQNPNLVSFSEIKPDQLHVIGGKALNLGLLEQSGLPVPEGLVITVEEHQHYIETGEISPQIIDALKELRNHLGGEVAIRSSATIEDGSELSMAGVFETHYIFNDSPDSDIEAAIISIYNQANSPAVHEFLSLHSHNNVTIEMGIVVQRLISPEISGVIYLGEDGDKTLIHYTDGFGDKLVDGLDGGSTIELDIASRVINSSSNFARLPLSQKALDHISLITQEIFQVLGPKQDIEFALADGQIFLLQSRPLTENAPIGEQKETLLDTLETARRQLIEFAIEDKDLFHLPYASYEAGNFHELLPHPKEMDFYIFSTIFTGQDGIPGGIQIGRIMMGYSLGMETLGYTRYIAGKPYTSNVRGLANFYIGFPEPASHFYPTLGLEYITKIEKGGGGYSHMDIYLQNPTLEDLKKRFPGKAERYLQIATDFNANLARYASTYKNEYLEKKLPEAENFINRMEQVNLEPLTLDQVVDYIDTILEHLRTSSCVDFVVAARLGFYYTATTRDLIKRYLHKTAEEADQIFAELNQGIPGSRITEVNLVIASAETEEEAIELARKLIGHFSTKEMLEIRHPLLYQNDQKLVEYVRNLRNTEYIAKIYSQRTRQANAKSRYENQVPPENQNEFSKTVDAALIYMGLRETVKYHFSKEYALLKRALEMIESRLGLNPGDIYSLAPSELRQFIQNPNDYIHLIKSRQTAFSHYSQLDFPNLIKEADIEKLGLMNETTTDYTTIIGKFLSHGEPITGQVVNLDEFPVLEDARRLIQEHRIHNIPVILVAQQMNLTHDPLISMADGLILGNAGIASHGAQRARELGRGALGGIQTRKLKTGQTIMFDPSNTIITKIAEVS